MADMLKTIPPLFGLNFTSPRWAAETATGGAPSPSLSTSAAAGPKFGPVPARGLEDTRAQLKRALANGGRRLLLRQFLAELSKVLDEQHQVLSLLETSRAWCLPVLNRQFYAVRTAGESLGLRNLAQVAGRAEVLVNLVHSGAIAYEENHGSVIRETHALLKKLVTKVVETDTDDSCYAITQTVWSMHAALNPALCEYEPGVETESGAPHVPSEPDQG